MTGNWMINKMIDFDDIYLSIEVDPYIKFNDGGALFQFGLVRGIIEFGDSEFEGKSRIEFTWIGSDEMDEVWGTGEILKKSESEITGLFRFDSGDNYGFEASKVN